ncbi:MAG: helix-turn-helix domain-containing protein [Deltaproteobacteria bacterium]
MLPTEEPQALLEIERLHIEKMLAHNDWNIAKTARLLKIDRTTLHKKIKKFGLERQQ